MGRGWKGLLEQLKTATRDFGIEKDHPRHTIPRRRHYEVEFLSILSTILFVVTGIVPGP